MKLFVFIEQKFFQHFPIISPEAQVKSSTQSEYLTAPTSERHGLNNGVRLPYQVTPLALRKAESPVSWSETSAARGGFDVSEGLSNDMRLTLFTQQAGPFDYFIGKARGRQRRMRPRRMNSTQLIRIEDLIYIAGSANESRQKQQPPRDTGLPFPVRERGRESWKRNWEFEAN